MTADKTLRSFRAVVDRDVRGQLSGSVHVHAIAAWLKTEPLVSASLTPAEARHLATSLLVAAEAAERQP